MAFKKDNDRKEDARDTCIKRFSCGIGLFLVFLFIELCFPAMSATINLDVYSGSNWSHIYISERHTNYIKSDYCCSVPWNRDLYGLS